MKLLVLWTVVVCAVGCSGRKAKARIDGPFSTTEQLLAAAEARVEALCDCPDQACRGRVMSAPDNPFGAVAASGRAQFSPAERVRYAELLKRSVACTTGT